MIKYTESHEWVNIENEVATVGVTEYAQKELGEIVYVELPEVGRQVKAGAEAAVLESTKAAADVYAPVSGTITEVNNRLSTASELVNQSPEKEGWLFKIKIADRSEWDRLKTAEEYQKLTRTKGT